MFVTFCSILFDFFFGDTTRDIAGPIDCMTVYVVIDVLGVGLGRVVRKMCQHPDDHEFESQQWQ
jgi:hypothetical protein